jgi:hypothetical protein
MKTALTVVALALVAACTGNPPNTTVQRLYAMEWTVTGAATSLKSFQSSIPEADYNKAKALVVKMADAVDCGKMLANIKVEAPPKVCPVLPTGASGPLGYLELAQSTLNELSAYYAAKGE